jgi:hypothetical protein
VVDADAHETGVGGHIVDPVGDRLADGVSGKIVHIDELRLFLGLPLARAVFEVADELLLLGVDGHHGNATIDAVLSLRVDVLELRVAIGVLCTLDRLVGCLQAVAMLTQKLRDRLVTDAYAVSLEQFGGKRVRALTCPAQRGFRVPSRHWIDQLLQRRPHFGMGRLLRSFPSASPHIDDIFAPRAGTSLVPPLPYGADRQSGRTRDRGHAAVANCIRLRPGPQAPRSLVQRRLQQAPLLADRSLAVQRRT